MDGAPTIRVRERGQVDRELAVALEGWDSDQLDALERLVDDDEANFRGWEGVFSALGRGRVRAAIARRRET